jgi:lipopolysaccharide biosynthesis regulator YciM
MTTPAQQDFCAHGFTIGFCPHNCMKFYYGPERAQQKRQEFLRLFRKRREWRNPITRATIILKLQQFHREEQYVQLPINLINFGNVRMYERPVDLTPQPN